jgi:FkbM family methyltransferase
MNIDLYLSSPAPHLDVLRFLYKDATLDIILDIGACEGEDSMRYLRQFPTAKVLAFEPVPNNIQIIKQRITGSEKERFTLSPCAVGGKDGERRLHLSSGRPPHVADDGWDYGNKSSSLLEPADLMSKIHNWIKFESTIPVDVISLPTIFARYALEYVNLIHLDVQGAELEILEGAVSILSRVQCVWLEVADRAIYRGQPTAEDVRRFLELRGFSRILDLRTDGFGDQLYIQPSRFHVRPLPL